MRKIVVVVIGIVWCNMVLAGDLSNPAVMMAAADRAVAGVSLPVMAPVSVDTGMAVAPAIGGAVAAVDIGKAKTSVKKQGWLQTINPLNYPKTSISALVAGATLAVKNNPKWLGLEKKDTSMVPASSSGNSAVDNSVHVTVSGSTYTTVVVQSPSTESFK